MTELLYLHQKAEKIIIKDGVLSLVLGNTVQAGLELFLSILNLPGTSDVLDQALARWEEEKANYFGEDEIQEMRNIIQFRKGWDIIIS